MDYSKSNMLTIDLNTIYEAELHTLVRENEAIRVQNETLKLQLKAERKKNKVLQDELKELKKNHEKSDASETLPLCSGTTLCRGLDLVKKQHTAEMDKLSAVLFRAKQALKEFTNKLYKEKTQMEADKLDAIEIAEEFFKITEELQKAQKKVLLPTVHVEEVKPASAVFKTQVACSYCFTLWLLLLYHVLNSEQQQSVCDALSTHLIFVQTPQRCRKKQNKKSALGIQPRQNLSRTSVLWRPDLKSCGML